MIHRNWFRKGCIFVILSVVLWTVCVLCMQHATVLTQEVLQADQHTKNWTRWIYELYPRLQTEKWRFKEDFFISKAKQLLIRAAFSIQFLIVLSVFRSYAMEVIRTNYNRLINQTIQRKFIPYTTLLLYMCLLLVVYNAILEFKALTFFSSFYKANGIGKLLLPVFPSIYMLWVLYVALMGSITAVIIFPKKWISASVAAISFIYYQLILFGFGKYDHGFVTLTYALLIYPFFLWEVEKTKDNKISAWSIVLIQWMICLAYFYCALEKLFTSGISWFYSNNLQQHLLIHETPFGLRLATYTTLCQVLSFGVVALQLSFILLPFQKRLAYILLPAGFIFHGAAWLLLDAGGLFNPWWGVYLFFLFPLQAQETK